MSNSETLEKTERKTNWINSIMPILSERYKDWSITAIEDKKAIFIYNDISVPKKEITFIETEGDKIPVTEKGINRRWAKSIKSFELWFVFPDSSNRHRESYL